MIRVCISILSACCLLLILATNAAGDVRAEEKTRVELAGMLGRVVNVFGGKGAREGVTSMVAVKGPRKIIVNDTTGQIIDLSEEKVYDLDMKKKTYTVTTFAELRRRMEEARQKAQEAARKEQPKEAAPPPQPSETNVEVDFDIKNTGQKKTVNGFDTQQAVMTITVREKGKTLDQSGGLVMTTDMWMAPRIAAMKEIADFDIQYAQKLYGPMLAGASSQDMATVLALYPMMKPALTKLSAEAGKLQGTPVMTVTTVEGVKSAEQFAAEQKESDTDSKPTASGGIGGLVGGLARRAAKNKVEGDAKPRTTVMTTTNEVLKVTTDVSANDVAVPPGFKQQ